MSVCLYVCACIPQVIFLCVDFGCIRHGCAHSRVAFPLFALHENVLLRHHNTEFNLIALGMQINGKEKFAFVLLERATAKPKEKNISLRIKSQTKRISLMWEQVYTHTRKEKHVNCTDIDFLYVSEDH